MSRIYYAQRKANCKRCIFSLLHKVCIRCKTKQFECFCPIKPKDYLSLVAYKHPFPGSFSSVNPSLWNHKPIQLLSWGYGHWKRSTDTGRIQSYSPSQDKYFNVTDFPDESIFDTVSQNQWAFMDTKTRYQEDWMPIFHQSLWEWLAENQTLLKSDWPIWERLDELGIIALNSPKCFACSYCIGDCNNCPIDWNTPNNSCTHNLSIYTEYQLARERGHYDTASKLARKIAKMNWHMKTDLFDQNTTTGGK